MNIMKTIIFGILFVLGLIVMTGESVDGEFLTTLAVKCVGLLMVCVSAAGFYHMEKLNG